MESSIEVAAENLQLAQLRKKDLYLAQIIDKLQKNDSKLTDLDLSGWQYKSSQNTSIGDDEVKLLASALQNNTHLVRLNLNFNQIDYPGIEALASALKTNKTLKTLDLQIKRNQENKGRFALAGLLEKNHILEELSINQNTTDNDGFQKIMAAMENNTGLKKLELSYPLPSNDRLTKSIRDMLQKNIFLKNLIIDVEYLNEQQMLCILQPLMDSTPLEILNISNVNLTKTTVDTLIQILSKNQNLKQLNVKNGKIDQQDFDKLMQALEKNTSLTHLGFSTLQINHYGFFSTLMQMIEKNTTLRHLKFSNQAVFASFCDEEIKQLATALLKNKTLISIDISANLLKKINEVLYALETNTDTKLEKLYIGGNELDENSVKALASLISKNTSLQVIDLEGADFFTVDGLKELKKALEVNPRIVEVNIKPNCELEFRTSKGYCGWTSYEHSVVYTLRSDQESTRYSKKERAEIPKIANEIDAIVAENKRRKQDASTTVTPTVASAFSLGGSNFSGNLHRLFSPTESESHIPPMRMDTDTEPSSSGKKRKAEKIEKKNPPEDNNKRPKTEDNNKRPKNH